jgi:hypothetical protein
MTRSNIITNILWNLFLRCWWKLVKIAQIASINEPIKDRGFNNADLCEMLQVIREAEKD